MTEDELFFAALQRAPYVGASSRQLAVLRHFTHAEMMAGRIDGATQDRIGKLLDALEGYEFLRVDDYIGPNATDIAWNVVEVGDADGTWRRLFGAERFDEDNNEYDWGLVSRYDGELVGRATTDGLIPGTNGQPLRVIKVVRRPGEDSA